MIVLTTRSEIRQAVAAHRAAGKTIGLVPTMGALHEGHLSLIKRSVSDNGATVVSIFVNPAQFGPREDFSKYPRPLDDDVRMCAEARADVVFAPDPSEMYPADFSTFVEEAKLSNGLCGASRPTHFRGVTTVVAKLFNIVQPDRAYFGQKDAQQAAVIKRMVRDLDFPVEIVVMPTVREPDGLAMSSRNRFLKGAHRPEALVLSTALKNVQAAFAAGEKRASALKEIAARAVASAADARVDYIEIVDAENLEPAAVIARPALVALAVFVGDTRLIDNVTLVP